jgi:hypothetical protein
LQLLPDLLRLFPQTLGKDHGQLFWDLRRKGPLNDCLVGVPAPRRVNVVTLAPTESLIIPIEAFERHNNNNNGPLNDCLIHVPTPRRVNVLALAPSEALVIPQQKQ